MLQSKVVWIGFVIAMFMGVGFSACTSPPQAPAAVQAPLLDQAAAQRAIYAAKEGYGIALRAATAYAELKRCAEPAVQPCSSQTIVDQVVKARNVARDALAAGESAVYTPGFGDNVFSTAVASAQSAVMAFTTITSSLNK